MVINWICRSLIISHTAVWTSFWNSTVSKILLVDFERLLWYFTLCNWTESVYLSSDNHNFDKLSDQLERSSTETPFFARSQKIISNAIWNFFQTHFFIWSPYNYLKIIFEQNFENNLFHRINILKKDWCRLGGRGPWIPKI